VLFAAAPHCCVVRFVVDIVIVAAVVVAVVSDLLVGIARIQLADWASPCHRDVRYFKPTFLAGQIGRTKSWGRLSVSWWSGKLSDPGGMVVSCQQRLPRRLRE